VKAINPIAWTTSATASEIGNSPVHRAPESDHPDRSPSRRTSDAVVSNGAHDTVMMAAVM
jgi:hypothetical protein